LEGKRTIAFMIQQREALERHKYLLRGKGNISGKKKIHNFPPDFREDY